MSSVLHPVGPEQPETYWVRRAIVIGVALVLVIVLMVALFNLSGGSQAAPAATPNPLPPASSTSPTPSASSPAPSSSASSSSAGSVASSSASPSSSATDTMTPSESASGSSSSSASAKASEKSASKTVEKSTESSGKSSGKSEKSAKPSASASTPAAPVTCNPDDLRPTLRGAERTVKPKQSLEFALSFVNTSKATCTLSVDGSSLELKIYSGTDRIWSTNDCSTAIKATKKTLEPDEALALELTWNGRRSAKSCENRPEIPRAGTYFATSQLKGAKPVQFRVLVS